jgi:hypothetical protein
MGLKAIRRVLLTTACAAAAALAPSGVATTRAADSAIVPVTTAISSALQFPIDGAEVQRAQWIAVGHWGVDPCGGQVALVWGVLDKTLNAQSSWANPIAAYGNSAANSDCHITLNGLQSYDWPMLCTVIVHEYGHLAGHQHTTDPNDVMYPFYVKPLADCAGSSAAASPAPAATAPAVVPTARAAVHHAAARHHTKPHRKARVAKKHKKH